MHVHRQTFVWLAAAVAVTVASPVRGVVSVSDLPSLVQRADAVVRARAGEWEELPQPEGAAPGLFPRKEGARATLRVQALEVRKVLAGRCPDHVLIKGTYTGADALKEGEEAYVCLRRSPLPAPGALYEAANYGVLVLHVREDGRVRIPKHVHYLDGQKALLQPETTVSAEAVEAALRYYRGPEMTVRALKDVVALGEPLALTVTLTNRTSGPMTLAMDRGQALRTRFGLSLYDGRGRSVLENGRLLTREDMMDQRAFERLRGTVRLAPGDSVRRVVRFPLPPAQFVMPPERTRTCCLAYVSGRREEAWFGWQCAECPVRLRCADRTWTDTLVHPTDGLEVTLHVPGGWGPAHSTVGTPRRVWMRVLLSRLVPKPFSRDRMMSAGSGYSPVEVTRAERVALADHLEVRLGGRVLARPDAAPGGLDSLLERIRPGQTVGVRYWNLAEAVDFSRPGVYRVRLVVPDGEASAWSNEVRVRIPRTADDGPEEVP